MSPHGAYTFSRNGVPYGTETGQHQGLLAQATALPGVGSLTACIVYLGSDKYYEYKKSGAMKGDIKMPIAVRSKLHLDEGRNDATFKRLHAAYQRAFASVKE